MGDADRRLEEALTCPVCQDIFRDPRQLPCGHSMCMVCLEDMMEHSSDVPFCCPECRGWFGPIIKIQKSYTLTSIAEDFRENRRKREQQDRVLCDYCRQKRTLASKTCLRCEVSLCPEHVKDHLELPALMGHPLVRPVGDLQEKKCPWHEVLKGYSSVSGRYVCNVCARESKQASEAAEASAVLRRELTEHMDLCFETLEEQMRESNESVKKLQDELQSENLKASPSGPCRNSVTVLFLCLWLIVLYYAHSCSMENQTLKEDLQAQQNHMQRIYSNTLKLMLDLSEKNHRAAAAEGGLMLDGDTASPLLQVSGDLRTAERVETEMAYSSSSSRFDGAPQVLSARCFSTGTHVWEVEAEGYWDIAVSYRSIQRKGKTNSTFGFNSASWSLTRKSNGELFAYHNREKTVLPASLRSSRIAVTVDIEKGDITFSSVQSTITKLHGFRAELTEPVCLGLGLYRVQPRSRASIVKAW